MRRAFRLLVVVIVMSSGALARAGDAPEKPAAARTTGGISAAELTEALLVETNRVRAAHGRRALRLKAELVAAATDQTEYMALRLYTTHDNAFYGEANAMARVRRHGFEPIAVAENVASQPVPTDPRLPPSQAIAVGLVEAWMNSPGHRANLLSREFNLLGCAVTIAHGFNDVDYVFGAQVFAVAPRPEFNL